MATTAPSQTPSPGKNQPQPPLYPTGFIQGEHGTLIPVYHPQALNEYMGGASPTHTAPDQRPTATTANTGQTAQAFVAQPTWPGVPAPVIALPMPPQHLPAPQTAAPAHSQPPPVYIPGPAAAVPVRGVISGNNNNATSMLPHGPQQLGLQQASVQSGPTQGYTFPSHNSMGAIPSNNHSNMPKMPTSFSQPSLSTERSNTMHGQSHRRDSFNFGRSGANGGNMGRSPSVVRISNRVPSTAGGSGMDDHNNKGAFSLQQYPTQQPQPQPQTQTRPNLPHLQLGFNKYNSEGHSQMQWMASHPHQQQQQ